MTRCLRRLERNGLVVRHVVATSPVAVSDGMTPLGRPVSLTRAAPADAPA